MSKNKASNGVNLGFEQTLWQAADKMRNNMDAAVQARRIGTYFPQIYL